MTKQYFQARNFPAFLAVLMLLLANSSHIHLRYCLDGDEAPVSIHFETSESHPGAQPEGPPSEFFALSEISADSDVEKELSLDPLLAKLFNAADSVALLFVFVLPLSRGAKSAYLPDGHDAYPQKPQTLLPPSRAPPEVA